MQPPKELLHPSIRNGEKPERPPNNHASGVALCASCGIGPDALKYNSYPVCQDCIDRAQAAKAGHK